MTAASRRSLGSVSVPVRGVALSRPLSVVALVSRYLTNKLMEPRPLPKRPRAFLPMTYVSESHPVLAPLSRGCSELRGRLPGCYAPVCRCRDSLCSSLQCKSQKSKRKTLVSPLSDKLSHSPQVNTTILPFEIYILTLGSGPQSEPRPLDLHA